MEAESAAGNSAVTIAQSPTLTVRNADQSDSSAIADLLARAFPSLYLSTFGRMGHAAIVSLLRLLYDAGHLSLEDTRVAEIEGCLIGVMILHKGLSIGRGSLLGYWRLVSSQYGFFRALRIFLGGYLANLMLDQRIPRSSDLVYIEALAVLIEHRGKGVGSRLLADAEECAIAAGRSRLALHVLVTNKRARKLYERVGFRLWNRGRREPRTSESTSAWAAVLMVRRLPNAPAHSAHTNQAMSEL